MVRHNNMIPNGHFHKDWQKFVKVKLNQPMRKKRRHLARLTKMRKLAPMPVDKLRPIVRCPTVRYHTKSRLGRGFTLKELKLAGVNKYYARTIGIAVDQRRRDKSMQTLRTNALRLRNYMSNVKMIDQVDNKMKQAIGTRNVKGVTYEYLSHVGENILNPSIIGYSKSSYKAQVPTEEDKSFKAYETLRKARNEKRKMRKKLKKKEKESTFEFAK